MKKLLTLLLLISFSSAARASGSFSFYPSSIAAIGGLSVGNGILFVGTNSKPTDEYYYSTWIQGGLGVISTQPANSPLPAFAVHNLVGDDVFQVRSDGAIITSSQTALGPVYVSTTPVDHRLASYVGNKNDWLNIVVQNTSNGVMASSDVQAFSDTGTEDYGYIDMGIQSSGFNDPAWSFAGPYDGYLFVQGPASLPAGAYYGDLSIGTKSTGTSVKFFVGVTTYSDLKVSISTMGITLSSTTAITLSDSTRISSASDLAIISTSTLIRDFLTTQTSGLACMTGSTVTWTTTTPSTFFITSSGNMVISTASRIFSLTFMVDSTFIIPTSQTSALIDRTTLANDKFPTTANYITSRTFPAGIHTACLMVWTSGNNLSIPAGDVVSFGVMSLRQ